MELLSVLSKFFNTTWHDSQLLFSYQSFSKTFLSRHCPKFSQACEWDFSWPDSSATHFPLPITIKHFRCQAVHIIENLDISLRVYAGEELILQSLTLQMHLFRKSGVFVFSFQRESVSWKSEEFVSWVFYSKALPCSSSLPASSLNRFLAPLQFFFYIMVMHIIICWPVAEGI